MNRIELEERLIDFSVIIIELASKLKKTKPAVIIENQILRSGTSCALNYGEVLGAESMRDFIHKIQVVLKELRETHIALRIISKAKLCTDLTIVFCQVINLLYVARCYTWHRFEKSV